MIDDTSDNSDSSTDTSLESSDTASEESNDTGFLSDSDDSSSDTLSDDSDTEAEESEDDDSADSSEESGDSSDEPLNDDSDEEAEESGDDTESNSNSDVENAPKDDSEESENATDNSDVPTSETEKPVEGDAPIEKSDEVGEKTEEIGNKDVAEEASEDMVVKDEESYKKAEQASEDVDDIKEKAEQSEEKEIATAKETDESDKVIDEAEESTSKTYDIDEEVQRLVNEKNYIKIGNKSVNKNSPYVMSEQYAIEESIVDESASNVNDVEKFKNEMAVPLSNEGKVVHKMENISNQTHDIFVSKVAPASENGVARPGGGTQVIAIRQSGDIDSYESDGSFQAQSQSDFTTHPESMAKYKSVGEITDNDWRSIQDSNKLYDAVKRHNDKYPDNKIDFHEVFESSNDLRAVHINENGQDLYSGDIARSNTKNDEIPTPILKKAGEGGDDGGIGQSHMPEMSYKDNDSEQENEYPYGDYRHPEMKSIAQREKSLQHLKEHQQREQEELLKNDLEDIKEQNKYEQEQLREGENALKEQLRSENNEVQREQKILDEQMGGHDQERDILYEKKRSITEMLRQGENDFKQAQQNKKDELSMKIAAAKRYRGR